MSQATKHNPGGQAHGSTKEYINGLIGSIILTVIPFSLVMADIGSRPFVILVILLCAIAQILVQLVYFLHMNTSSKQMWNTSSAVFVIVIAVILLLGTIWIMQHLNHNMLMGH